MMGTCGRIIGILYYTYYITANLRIDEKFMYGGNIRIHAGGPIELFGILLWVPHRLASPNSIPGRGSCLFPPQVNIVSMTPSISQHIDEKITHAKIHSGRNSRNEVDHIVPTVLKMLYWYIATM